MSNLYVTDRLCHNAEPGTYGHECGKPATWIGTNKRGFSMGYCDACKATGYEARDCVAWKRMRDVVEFQACFAYPTSPYAEQVGRYRTGCWLVERSINHAPPVLVSGPWDNETQARLSAKCRARAYRRTDVKYAFSIDFGIDRYGHTMMALFDIAAELYDRAEIPDDWQYITGAGLGDDDGMSPFQEDCHNAETDELLELGELLIRIRDRCKREGKDY